MYDIKEIKEKITIPGYLQRLGIHVEQGKRCVSPLRKGAKNPTSFLVDNDRWYDFGCAMGGDVIDLAAEMNHNSDKGAAIRELAAIAGVYFDGDDNSREWKRYTESMNGRAALYHENLTEEDYKYLAARGLSAEDAKRLLIGRVTDGHLKGRLFLPYFKNG